MLRAARIRGAGANPIRLQDGAQSPLDSDGVAAGELTVAEGHAAEILRPRAILRRVDHDVADPLRSHLLRLRGKPQVGVDLAFGEELHRFFPGAAGDASEADRSR